MLEFVNENTVASHPSLNAVDKSPGYTGDGNAPPHDEDFHDLVAERYERGATVLTSNPDFAEWGDAFPNQLLGAATLDRLRHGAYRVILDSKSYRSPRPMEARVDSKIKIEK